MAQPAASTKVTFVMFESDIIPAIVTTRTMSGASGGTTMESEAWSTRKELVMGGRMNDAADAVSAVKVSKLVKRYGDMLALDYFDLDVHQGEIFGLLGPNGSGKTTAINCILALLTFDEGTVRVFGEPISPTSYALKRRIGIVPQNVAVFNELTVEENIDYFCSLYVSDKAKRRMLVDEALDFVGLRDYRTYRPAKLSGGLLRRLNIACGIAHKPDLIFFDEPTVAVDPQSRNAILEGIQRLNREGATVIYTSYYMEEVEQICDRVMIMDHGRALAQGTPDELKGIEEKLPKQLDWVGDDYGYGGVYSKNGRTLSSEDAKLYLFDDLGVSQRWTNKFSEVGIETVGDLIGKTEDDLLRIDGIGAKAIEELRDGLEARGLLYILEPDDDEADSEDLSQLLNMVFSPDADSDIMLGTAAPAKHHYDDELIGGSADARSSDSDVINEDLGSLDDLLSQVVKQENASDDGDENNE